MSDNNKSEIDEHSIHLSLTELDPTNSDFYDRLILALKVRNKSVVWLHNQLSECGIKRGYETVLGWTNGMKRPIRLADIYAIADILNISIVWLLLGYRDTYTAYSSTINGVMIHMPLRDVLALVPDDTKVVLVNKSTDKQYNIFANSVADLLETFTNVTILSIKRKTEANGFVLVVEIETKTDSK